MTPLTPWACAQLLMMCINAENCLSISIDEHFALRSLKSQAACATSHSNFYRASWELDVEVVGPAAASGDACQS